MAYTYSKKTFQDLVRLSGWTSKDGDYPGVFKDKTPGEKCVWSRNWITDDGVLTAEQGAPADIEGLRYELKDLAQRGDTYAASLLVGDASEHAIRVHLQEARRGYGDFYHFPFTPKSKYLKAIMVRPGWSGIR